MLSISVSPKLQKIHSSPHFQRYYSVPPPVIEDELENAISQDVIDNDITRTPSSNAVFDYVQAVNNELKIQRFHFNDPSSSWIVSHNNNTNIFQESIFASNNQKMIAPITIIDDNNFEIHLTEPLTGYVDVRF